MDPDQMSRRDRYNHIASNLLEASHLYQKAAKGIDENPEDQNYYRFIKDANHLVEQSFPEKFQAPVRPFVNPKAKIGFDWEPFLKVLIPSLIILGILFYLVTIGTSGDLTKTWKNPEEVIKNSQYPKQPQ